MAVEEETCDVCIVGAGLAGMNALFVVSKYLTPGQRVILVDRRARVGGMWVDTYPYVRLHQPHGMFTAGDIEWTLNAKPSHLASKGEVLHHFQHCLDVIKRDTRVDEFFGWGLESDEEADGGVRVTCRSAEGRTMVIETGKLIKAYGFRVEPNDPLTLGSPHVRSVSPDSCDMRSPQIRDSGKPVWIIGGGKTAMDTAHTLITADPGREVNLVTGPGTFFNNRDQFFPTGFRRWVGGTTVGKLGSQIAQRYDGTNEEEVWDWHRSTYGVWATEPTGSFVLGVLSSAEKNAISAGLSAAVNDYLVDVVDEGDSTELVLRGGGRHPVERGSWIVNCTGYVTQREDPYEPYVSAGGNVLSISPRSATLHLTSYMAYFGTHLLLTDTLRTLPLYEIDLFALQRKSKKAFPYATFTLVQHNMSLLADSLPNKVFRECGLDFNRWYPFPRQLATNVKFLRTHRAERERHRRTLDTLRERFGVRCGPLV
ncbi:FAD-dependent oxidoreductase [Mycobacterium sp. 236(2023)]|uniref:FAD-dependent oxidoreductase n=1 Tax=Mycobacterium sp. 236(2023) TaxID=3038163 RepID=UPI002414EF70|nr:FAD-dependent oxidoreductase [Mycobacterium sp. 236(2023)]MDG4667088.1 FAD-dependent oxidoreductase [Mycobacterium sp. 236(2023)]